MGVARPLGKGDGNQLQYLEDAFNRADEQTLTELRRQLLADTPLTSAVASTVLVNDGLLGQWNRVGANWYGPAGTNQWLEPCTSPEQIQQRVATAWITMVDLALETKPKATIELWAKCGHPNFEALVTSRRIGNTGLVIVTLLTPDVRSGYPGGTTTEWWPKDRPDPATGSGGYSDARAASIGTQPYASGGPGRSDYPSP
jgi:hypothetical protein